VHATKALDNSSDSGLHRFFTGDVDMPVLRLHSLRQQVVYQHGAGFIEHVEQGDMSTFFGQSQCTCATDAQGRADDDTCFSLYPIHGTAFILSKDLGKASIP
jgi:hypothetical protein